VSLKLNQTSVPVISQPDSLSFLLHNPYVLHTILDRGTQEMKSRQKSRSCCIREGNGLISEYQNEVFDIINLFHTINLVNIEESHGDEGNEILSTVRAK